MMLAWHFLLRDSRSAELRLLAVSLVLAVAIVTAIAGFAQRLELGMSHQSASLLGADRVLSLHRDIPLAWSSRAESDGLRAARSLEFQSMVFAGQTMQLASIKAVSTSYPLRGDITLRQVGGERNVTTSPASGEVWLEPRLLTLLGINIGERVDIGEASFLVTAEVLRQPDAGFSMAALAPQAVINVADVAATEVIQPGSRISYRWLLAGASEDLRSYRLWLDPQLKAGERWLDVESSQPSVSLTLKRARVFLLLGASVGVCLAGLAVALAAHQYSRRHSLNVAILKTLGASRRRILILYAQQFLLLAAATISLGCLLGFLAQEALVRVAATLFTLVLPGATWSGFGLGAITGLVCLAAYALPPLWRLQQVAPLQVLRAEQATGQTGRWQSLGIGMGGIFTLMTVYSGNLLLSLGVLSGLILIAVLLAGGAALLLLTPRRIGLQAGGAGLLALANLRRQPWASAAQIMVFALAMMFSLLLLVTRTSLIDDWQKQLPEGTPNQFLINIRDDQRPGIERWLVENNLKAAGIYPMIRGRLIAINGVSISLKVTDEQLTRAGANRELNLSWSAHLPEDNTLVRGSWWPPAESVAAGVSVEQSFAEHLGIELGDVLSFSVGSEIVSAPVASVRSLHWDSMRPNFYVLFAPGLLDPLSASFITSVYVPPTNVQVLSRFAREFPTVSIIDTEVILSQVRSTIRQVTLAVQTLAQLVMVASLLVIIAAVLASLKDRLREYALLRTIGASRRLILGSLWMEFGLMGAMAGLLAAAATELSVYLMQTQLLALGGQWHGYLWLLGPSLGAVMIGLLGYLTCRRVVSVAPMVVLREMAN